jgi:hypothetical protein
MRQTQRVNILQGASCTEKFYRGEKQNSSILQGVTIILPIKISQKQISYLKSHNPQEKEKLQPTKMKMKFQILKINGKDHYD